MGSEIASVRCSVVIKSKMVIKGVFIL